MSAARAPATGWAVTLALALALALGLASAPAARAQGLLEPADAAELAQILAEAKEEQGVCYGWDVRDVGVSALRDVGSSDGPGVALNTAACQKYALLEVELEYTCDSCEAEDSARFAVTSNLPDPPTVEDLERLGYDSGDLLGDRDDVTVFDMASALPLIVAERGEAPFIQYEVPQAVPPQDRATNSPGSDFLRTHWPTLALFILLTLCGIFLFFYARSRAGSKPPPPARGKTIIVPNRS